MVIQVFPIPSGAAGAPSRTAALFPYPPAKKFVGKVDAVFTDGRDPFKGFIDLEIDVVKTLTGLGFRWGPTSFGGDVMHFDHPATSAKAVAEFNAANPP